MLQLEAFARGERHEATRAAAEAISSSGAWIVDTHFFSGVAVNIIFETTGRDVGRLLSALRDAGLSVSGADDVDTATDSDAAVLGTLRLTFIDGDPSLRRTIPSVPG